MTNTSNQLDRTYLYQDYDVMKRHRLASSTWKSPRAITVAIRVVIAIAVALVLSLAVHDAWLKLHSRLAISDYRSNSAVYVGCLMACYFSSVLNDHFERPARKHDNEPEK